MRPHDLLSAGIDVGTTTIVIELVDLLTNATVCLASLENPQRLSPTKLTPRAPKHASVSASRELVSLSNLGAIVEPAKLPVELTLSNYVARFC
jgi:hypothetical protein